MLKLLQSFLDFTLNDYNIIVNFVFYIYHIIIMNKLILLLVLSLMPLNISALTLDEATLYGSRILVCNNSEVKYWKLIQAGNKNNNSSRYLIYDILKYKSYSLNECSLYKCSPEPDRMNKCIMRDK